MMFYLFSNLLGEDLEEPQWILLVWEMGCVWGGALPKGAPKFSPPDSLTNLLVLAKEQITALL